jgi:hypothetical protein
MKIKRRMKTMAKVTVEGRGVFEITNEKLGELLGWLSSNQAVAIREQNTVREVNDNEFTGRELLNG